MLTVITITGMGPDEWRKWYGSQDEVRGSPASEEILACEPTTGYPDCIVLANGIDEASAFDLTRAISRGTGSSGCSAILAEQIHPDPSSTPLSLARMAPDGSGHLYLAFLNVDEEAEADFNEWYNSRHLPIVASAGLLDGVRFEATSGIHKYVALYRMAHAGVLESDEIAQVRGFEEFTPYVHDLTRQVLQVR